MRQILAGLFALGCIAANVVWGSAISTLLTVAIVASVVYYLLQLRIEQFINANYQQGASIDLDLAMLRQKQKLNAIAALCLLAIVFVVALITVKRTVNPTKQDAWFNNIDHHSVAHIATAFTNTTSLLVPGTDSAYGKISFSINGDNGSIKCNDVYEPIFKRLETDDNKILHQPINNIFQESFAESFTLKNSTTSIVVRVPKDAAGFYTASMRCTDAAILQELNLSSAENFVLQVKAPPIKRGIRLYDLLLANRTQSNNAASVNAYPLLERLLRDMPDVLLLNSGQQDNARYFLFPDKGCLDAGYTLVADSKPCAAQRNINASIKAEQAFYIGLGNSGKLLRLSNKNGKKLLAYDYPPQYSLQGASVNNEPSRFLRFMTHNFNKVLSSSIGEGYYFHNYNLLATAQSNAIADYYNGATNEAVALSITDLIAQKDITLTTDAPVYLNTNEAGVQHVIQLSDQSVHGFSYNKMLLYLSILALAIAMLLIFAPGKSLERIEPVIWVSVFCLFVVRCILSWRIASFPPSEGISKYELEQTLVGFDFHFKSLDFPLPISLLFILFTIITLAVYRLVPQVKTILSNWFHKIKGIDQYNKLPIYFAACLGFLLVVHAVSSQEVLRRIVDVLLPVLLYLLFAYKRNALFTPSHVNYDTQLPQWRNRLQGSLYYLAYNPSFSITLIAAAYFAITDRGFCILFLLFILLKNIIINFLKRAYEKNDEPLWRMLLRGRNFWMYGILALAAYLCILGIRPLFYYMLQYKLVVVCAAVVILGFAMFILQPKQAKVWKSILGLACVLIALTIIPFTRNKIDNAITEQIKHVQYRASIITQPIAQLLEQNPYSGFSTKKIIETAENQWFINTYLSKPYDNSRIINLRAFTKVGVNFSTQTRDVVVARFIIGELGNFVMVLLLAIVALPMLIYLLSYKLRNASAETDDASLPRLHLGTYIGLLPLLFLFTVALFVWLTSTNRFVFFGQDFPFLSITSRIAVLLPMLLFATTLTQKPQPYFAGKINLSAGILRYALLLASIITVVLVTGRKNELNGESFNATVPSAQQFIDTELNSILQRIQQTAATQGKRYNYAQLIAALQNDEQYKSIRGGNLSPYMTSILSQLERDPAMATKVNSPLYIVYNRGMYEAQYNKSLYLQLPPVENRLMWNGSIYEQAQKGGDEVTLNLGGTTQIVKAPFVYRSANGALQLAIMPASWVRDAADATAIVSLSKDARKAATVMHYSASRKSMKQSAASMALALQTGDVAYVQEAGTSYELGITSNKNLYASNKYVNGEYRTLYPLRNDNFWIYHFANAVKSAYSSDSLLLNNVQLSLDYNLHKDVHQAIAATYGNGKSQNSKFRFSVIAADGDGRLLLMDDVVRNRSALDPNDAYAIYKLQQKHFFYSNTQNERDQWGNSNLTHMYLGPGSSVKPLVGAVIASSLNAGWENLSLNATMGAEAKNYAGLKLAIPWRNVDGESGVYDYTRYIEKSSNYFHSTLMFLGSYSKEAYRGADGTYSLANLLSTKAGNNNETPNLIFNNTSYHLPNYEAGKGNWPRTAAEAKSFFANNNSLVANGLELNANLATKSKTRSSKMAQERSNFTDSTFYARLSASKSSSFLWSFPELSTFLQQSREFSSGKKRNEIHENFLLGLQTPTLGGSPYRVSAHKLVEMYASLFTQNRDYRAHILPQKMPYTPWFVDTTWQYNNYKQFLAQNVFSGMRKAVQSGTATALNGVATGYFVYAKTGTINDGDARSSRRLVVCITDKDVTQADNIGSGTKVYTLYFMTDGTGDFNWALVRDIIAKAVNSNSFKQYFGQ
ncbi:MAG: hypothetical protein RL660_1213 [Bacteroidota bacterium]|jgi:hypothetical protein